MQKGHDTKGKGARKETWGVGDNLFQGERQARVSAASMQSRGDAGAPSSLGAKPNSLQVLGPAWKKAGDGRAEQCEDAQFLQRTYIPGRMSLGHARAQQPARPANVSGMVRILDQHRETKVCTMTLSSDLQTSCALQGSASGNTTQHASGGL